MHIQHVPVFHVLCLLVLAGGLEPACGFLHFDAVFGVHAEIGFGLRFDVVPSLGADFACSRFLDAGLRLGVRWLLKVPILGLVLAAVLLVVDRAVPVQEVAVGRVPPLPVLRELVWIAPRRPLRADRGRAPDRAVGGRSVVGDGVEVERWVVAVAALHLGR